MLEFQWHWHTTKPLAPGQFWFAYNFSHDGIILQEQLQIGIPRNRPVKWKSSSLKPVLTEDSASRFLPGLVPISKQNRRRRKRKTNRSKPSIKRRAASFLHRRSSSLAFKAGKKSVAGIRACNGNA